MKRTLQHTLGILLAFAILLTAFPFTAVSAAYENTHINTGNQAVDIMAIAETQVGYLEGSLAGTTAGSNNLTKYGAWYDDYFNSSSFTRAAWCAMFVSWCAAQADIPPSIFTYHASCTAGVRWWKQQNCFEYSQYYDGNYVPKAGDVIYFGDSRTSMSHVGLVRYAEGGRVYTIEGNTSGQNGEVNEGGGCFRKSYSLGYSRIVGYATPNYEVGAGTAAAKIGTYKITASSLNVRAGTSTSYDILGELLRGDIVYISELSGEWGKVKLSDGTEGWCSIGTYGEYIGVDVLGSENAAAWGNSETSLDADGRLTITNRSSTDPLGYDFVLPQAIGTMTTPYLSVKVEPKSGNGYYFGVTQSDTGYFMMHDGASSDPLVLATEASFITKSETLSIDMREYWKPDEGYRIDCIRFYIAPSSSITVEYAYFATVSDKVTDTTYNLVRAGSSGGPIPSNNVSLMVPEELFIVDDTKKGSYTYSNGMLTVVSEEDDLYEVAMNVNIPFEPEKLTRLLYSVDADVRYDIELVVTTSEGDRIVSLAQDFWPDLCAERDGDYLPAKEQMAGLNLIGVYTFNGVMPEGGVSTVKKVIVQAGGKGSVIVNTVQINDNDTLVLFPDGKVVSDYSPKGEVTLPVLPGDVDNDGSVGTSDARAVLMFTVGLVDLDDTQLVAADINSDGNVSTTDARDILMMTVLN